MTIAFRNEDCRNARPSEFDAMICDPPYSKHVHEKATSQSAKGGTRFRDLGFDCLTPELRAAILDHATKVKRWSLIYTDVEGLGEWLRLAAPGHYLRSVPWVRWSMPQLSGDRPPQGFELVTCWYGRSGGRKSWNGPGNLTHLAHLALRGEDKHRCEKPLDQALDLVQWFTDEGELVLDPTAGSGVIGLACAILRRRYIGYELSARWCDSAHQRVTKYVERGELSQRDEERLQRWRDTQVVRQREAEVRAAHTAKVRARPT